MIYRSEAGSIPAAEASQLLRELVEPTGTSAPSPRRLMGRPWRLVRRRARTEMGMLGCTGTYEANMAMHDCDVMLCIAARFRTTA